MTDSAKPPVSLFSMRRIRAWQPKLRWFASQILVVTSGVLLAAALNAWWGNRQDAVHERAYLRQLAADLRETERRVARADSITAPRDRAGARLVQAYYEPVLLPADSVIYLLRRSFWTEEARPVLGTAEALISTGDLNLIRDDSLRAAITAYLDQMRQVTEGQHEYVSLFLASGAQFYRQIDFGALDAILMPQRQIDSIAQADPLSMLPAGPRRDLKPLDTDRLLRDEAIHALLKEMTVEKKNLRAYRREMIQSSATLRSRVERALAE